MPEEKSNSGLSRKMKVRNHSHLPNAINSFMIANSYGALCGGNRREFFPNDEIWDEEGRPTLRYPAVFKSKLGATLHMINDSAYMEELENA